MGELRELPRITPKEEPSYFNHTAGQYAAMAALVGGVFTGLRNTYAGPPATVEALTRTRLFNHVVIGLGAAIGAVQGKKAQTE